MSKKIPVSGAADLSTRAFGGLESLGLPSAPAPAPVASTPRAEPARGGRVHLRIEKSGRSGKTVTVLFGEGITRGDDTARERLLKELKGALGCGGAVADGLVELQGDVRERAAVALRAAGFSVK